MPVSVVVGGQYGSEGKGKVALELVRRDPSATIVLRPGGTNSGHTGFTKDGRRLVLRQLPAAAIDCQVRVFLPAGSYIDVELLEREIADVGLPPSHVVIDPRANVIRRDHVRWEKEANLTKTIGSTGSGTGAAVLSRIARFAPGLPHATQAAETPELLPYLADTTPLLEQALKRGERVIVEGTQGFGLSPIHGDAWPKCTSRDTTAAAFLSEAGLSPLHVDEVVLVMRCHPIRVAGDSGPLAHETTWRDVARDAGTEDDLTEFTSVTQKVRRVGRFDAEVVRRSISVNSPTLVVLNHLDYIGGVHEGRLSQKAQFFVRKVEQEIGHRIHWIGLGPNELRDTAVFRWDAAEKPYV